MSETKRDREEAEIVAEPVDLGGSGLHHRDRTADLRRELKRQQRTAVSIAVVVVVGVGLIAALVSHFLLRQTIVSQVRGGEVVDRLRNIEAEAQRSAQRIANLIQDANGKLDASVRTLEERSGRFDQTVASMMQTLADNAAATKRGFQIQAIRFNWQTGQEPVKMIPAREGVCFIYHIQGNFEGPGESVSVDIGEDGHWWIRGTAVQPLTIGVMALRIIPLTAEPPGDAGQPQP